MPVFALLLTFCFFLEPSSVQAQSSAARAPQAPATKASEPNKPAPKAKTLDPFTDAQKVLDEARAFHQQEEALSRKRLQQEGYKAPQTVVSEPISTQSAPANSTR